MAAREIASGERSIPGAGLAAFEVIDRHGEPIATGFVESAVNHAGSERFVKQQQMRWTPNGAHRVLQVRTRVLNQQLRKDFERWHPQLRSDSDPVRVAA